MDATLAAILILDINGKPFPRQLFGKRDDCRKKGCGHIVVTACLTAVVRHNRRAPSRGNLEIRADAELAILIGTRLKHVLRGH
jgi:hypothetical protein